VRYDIHYRTTQYENRAAEMSARRETENKMACYATAVPA